MAKNREPEKTHVESSDDEDDTDSESDSESEPEPEPQSQQQTLSAKKPAPAPTPAPAPQKKTPPPPSSSEDDTGSDSDTDSDATPHPVALKKPAAESPAATPPTKSTTAKRPAEKEPAATKESKKSKKPEPPAATTDSAKKNIFQRLFTDADVIVILQGMLDYQESKKISPTEDMDDFFEFIKKKLSADFTKAQVQDKIRRLRKNYSNQKNHNRNLTKTHDREVYSLFCKIWGDDEGKDMAVTTPKLASESAAKKTPAKKSNKVANGKADNVVGSEVVDNGGEEKKSVATRVNSYGLTAAERVLKIGAELFEGANAGVESAEKWRNLVVEDIEADLKKLDVVRAQTRLVLDVLKSANQ